MLDKSALISVPGTTAHLVIINIRADQVYNDNRYREKL